MKKDINPKAILQGTKNFLFKDDKIEEKAKERLAICQVCEHNSQKKIATCNICGCILVLKTRQNEQKCPINKW